MPAHYKTLGALSGCIFHQGQYEPSWNSLQRATIMLPAYSRRRLTYDSDALDAVVGSLERLTDTNPNFSHV